MGDQAEDPFGTAATWLDSLLNETKAPPTALAVVRVGLKALFFGQEPTDVEALSHVRDTDANNALALGSTIDLEGTGPEALPYGRDEWYATGRPGAQRKSPRITRPLCIGGEGVRTCCVELLRDFSNRGLINS